jgi:prevent-host-death family protein
MKTVGVRELKNRLSEYIRQARAGEGVLVTDRGEVVAELGPAGHRTGSSLPAGLLTLVRRNLLVIGAPADGDLYPPIPRSRRRKRTAAQLLQDARGNR